MSKWILSIVLLLSTTATHSQQKRANPQTCGLSPGVTFLVEGFRVQAVLSDHVTLTVQLRISTSQTIHLQGLSLSSVQLDGELPVFVHALAADIMLKAGESTRESLGVDIFYSDAASPKRLDHMLHAGQVHLSGKLSADLDLSGIRRLALLNLHPVAVSMLDQDVPVDPGAVPFSIVATLGAADLLQRGTEAAGSVLGIDTGQLWTAQPSERELTSQRSLLRVRTSYRAQRGAAPTISERLGFWIAPGLALVPDEALHPWAYDEAAAAAATNCEGGVDPSTVEVTLSPLLLGADGEPSPSWSFSRGDFRVEKQNTPTSKTAVVSNQRPRQIQVSSRSSRENWATLRLSFDQARIPLDLAIVAPGADAPLHVFRLVEPGRARAPLIVSGDVSPATVSLARPLDPSTFGSPVLSGDGTVVGMVLDEQYVLPVISLRAELLGKQ